MEGGDTAGEEKKNGLVKGAVALFEGRVHASDNHVHRVQPISKPRVEVEHLNSKLEKVTLELEETKQNLQKSIDEGIVMATCLSILEKELEQTKRELQELKEKDLYFRYKPVPAPSDEDWDEKDVKHVEDVKKIDVKPELIKNQKVELEFEKDHVAFADELSVTKVIVLERNPVLERHPSVRSKKKKSLVAGFFSRRKVGEKSHQVDNGDLDQVAGRIAVVVP
ncbi:hypothetical protein POM88_042518 [Heracleum sosnowskyi]|uniref:Uncharacterized protein n=1 Tax=Heracleum sosnowskyi TaxID=360622 RepID=A0AAD8HIR4_9APIA|nr:hypothetical protein POM88_042518 [Heracleum sosnowskyi]